MTMMTTSPGEVDTSMLAGRWGPAKCPGTEDRRGKRLFDENPVDRQIRVDCPRCGVNHTYQLEDGKLGRFLN
jgi:hypothetical protein